MAMAFGRTVVQASVRFALSLNVLELAAAEDVLTLENVGGNERYDGVGVDGDDNCSADFDVGGDEQ